MINTTTHVVMLGSGTPDPDPNRSGPAVAVVVNEKAYLVDCGANIIRQCAAMHRKGIMALKPSNLTIGFISHLHSDHVIGLPDLMLTPWIVGRTEPLNIYGPYGTKDMVEHLTQAFAVDIDERINGHIKSDAAGGTTYAHEFSEGVIYQDELVTVEALVVEHVGVNQSFAFKFTTPDKTIAISCDTNYSQAFVDFAKGCDILLHELYYTDGLSHLPAKWKTYHASVHTSSVELGQVAKEVQPKLLVPYHPVYLMGKNGANSPNVAELMAQRDQEMIADIRQHYQGDIRFAADLAIYS